MPINNQIMMTMRKKEENYAYLDDKDVFVDDVLKDVFDDGEYTYGNPDKDAVGFMKGYPFYASYSDCSNVLQLKCCNNIINPSTHIVITHWLEEQCNVDPNLKAYVSEICPGEWNVYFYFK